MGRPLPGYRVALLDANDKAQKEGEICLVLEPRPTGLMQGYQADDGGIRAAWTARSIAPATSLRSTTMAT